MFIHNFIYTNQIMNFVRFEKFNGHSFLLQFGYNTIAKVVILFFFLDKNYSKMCRQDEFCYKVRFLSLNVYKMTKQILLLLLVFRKGKWKISGLIWNANNYSLYFNTKLPWVDATTNFQTYWNMLFVHHSLVIK